MPLHDWTDLSGWEGVHQIWMVELLYWLQPRLPAGYRAYIGTTPTFAIDAPAEDRPDVGVRDWPQAPAEGANAAGDAYEEPDQEVALASLPTDKALLVERAGRRSSRCRRGTKTARRHARLMRAPILATCSRGFT